MHRRKSLFLLGSVAGGLLLAEAGALALVVQVDWEHADATLAVLSVTAALLWTFLLATGLVSLARHLLFSGMLEASARMESARASAHVGLLGAEPTIRMLGQAVEQQEAGLKELRDTLFAAAITEKIGATSFSGTQVARGAGRAAGLLQASANIRRLVVTLENWVVAARNRQESLRDRTAELRRCFESLPRPAAPVVDETPTGYAAVCRADGSDEPEDDLPAVLKQRLRGIDCWSPRGESEPDRN